MLYCVFWFALLCCTACLPRARSTDCSAVTNYATQELPLPNSNSGMTTSFDGCRWLGASVTWQGNGPFALTLHGVVLSGGTLVVNVTGAPYITGGSSTITVEDSVLDCVDCLLVFSSSSVVAVNINVVNTSMQATQSAVSLRAPVSVVQSSITIHNSTIAARCIAKTCRVASVQSAILNNVSVVASSSQLATAAAVSGDVCSTMAVVNTQANTFTIRATTVKLYAVRCNVSASCSQFSAVSAVGFLLMGNYNSPSSITAANVVLHAAESSISATGINSLSAVGFTSYNSNVRSSINVVNVTLFVVRSTTTTAGGRPNFYSRGIASNGFSSYGLTSSSLTAENVVVYVVGSSITTNGDSTISSNAFVSHSADSSGEASIAVTNSTLYAADCSISTAGDAVVATFGFISAAVRSNIDAVNVTLNAAHSSIAARVTSASQVALMGFLSRTHFSSGLAIGCCESRVVAESLKTAVGVASVEATTKDISAVRWALVQSIIASSGSCVTMVPSDTATGRLSVASDVVVDCNTVGWGTPAPYCSSNVTWSHATAPAHRVPFTGGERHFHPHHFWGHSERDSSQYGNTVGATHGNGNHLHCRRSSRAGRTESRNSGDSLWCAGCCCCERRRGGAAGCDRSWHDGLLECVRAEGVGWEQPPRDGLV